MDVDVGVPFIIVVFLVFVRLSALLLMTPLFSIAKVPLHFRLFLLLFLSLTLVSSLGISLPDQTVSVGRLIYYAAGELVAGAAMAFGLFAVFAAFSFGGRILDFQMGFGVASLIDPATNAQAPMIGTFLNMLGVLIFFLIDGHHMLIRGVAFTLQHYPPGHVPKIDVFALINQFGLMFVYGIMLVSPVIFTILLIDVAMGIAARTMPQVNMFIIMLPLKILVGLSVLMLTLRYLLPLMKKMYVSIFSYWYQLFPTP